MQSLCISPRVFNPLPALQLRGWNRVADESENAAFDNAEAKRLGAALRLFRQRAGKTLQEAAEAFGVKSGQAFSKYEQGIAPAIFRPETQLKLARAVNTTVDEWLRMAASLGGKATKKPDAGSARVVPFPAAGIPVRDRVQAGAWLAIDELGQVEPEIFPLVRDPRFPTADQWMAPVVGDSMDVLRIFDGDLVHVVDAVGIGYAPRTGDIVEVERIRANSLRELTIKQVEVLPDGVLLWPRSTNPRWSQPLDLTDGDPDVEVRVRGLVLTTVRRL